MSSLFGKRSGKSKGLVGLGIGGGTGKGSKDGKAASTVDVSTQGMEDTRLQPALQLSSTPSPPLREGAAAKTLPPLSLTNDQGFDEFGRPHERQRTTSPRGRGVGDKSRAAATTLPARSGSKNNGSAQSAGLRSPTYAVDGTAAAGPNATSSASGKEAYPYGYTHDGWDTEVTIAAAIQVVDLCGEQIRARGLDAPLIFSSMAIDLSAPDVSSLIRSFVASDHTRLAQSALAEQVRYAEPHNLAAMVKWTLARLSRFLVVPVAAPAGSASNKKGEVTEEMAVIQQRGWLELETYLAWKEEEKAGDYPWTAFSNFCSPLDEEAAQLLKSLFALLSSTSSYSLKNGMTPSKLARHFGPLLFGLPEDETFARTYEAYLRVSNATEHLLLAYIRDLAAYEVLPMRLMSHVDDYPAMLSADLNKPAKHVRAVPVTQVERNVRFYSQDLIQTAAQWDLTKPCEEWKACWTDNERHGRLPQLSDRYRKLLNLRGTTHLSNSLASVTRNASSARAKSLHSQDRPEDPSSYTSIADKEWSEFLNEGFAAPSADKLNFDLRESQRKARLNKRDTLEWKDFSDLGFDGDEAGDRLGGLSSVLSFDDGIQQGLQRWPDERQELLQKLRAFENKAPAFTYDNSPRIVASPSMNADSGTVTDNGEKAVTQMDEVFADVWADILIGNGWSNRDEPTHRAANFVILQYKSRPNASTVGTQSRGGSSRFAGDSTLASPGGTTLEDRTDAAWFVVQEIVPSSYRADLEAVGKSKHRSRPSLRKLKVFGKSRKERNGAGSHPSRATGTVGAALPAALAAESNKDPLLSSFPAETKKLQLSPDPATAPAPSVDLDRSGTVKTGTGGTVGSNTAGKRGVGHLFSSPIVSGHRHSVDGNEHSTDDQTASSNKSGSGGRLISTLRSKTIKRFGGGGAHSQTADAPSPPAKSPPLGTTEEGLKPQSGGFKAANDSFGSSDFETHSLADAENGEGTKEGVKNGKLNRTRSRLRHGRKESKDDTWVDVSVRDISSSKHMGASISAATSTSPPAKPNANGGAALQPVRSSTSAGSQDFEPVSTPTQERPTLLEVRTRSPESPRRRRGSAPKDENRTPKASPLLRGEGSLDSARGSEGPVTTSREEPQRRSASPVPSPLFNERQDGSDVFPTPPQRTTSGDASPGLPVVTNIEPAASAPSPMTTEVARQRMPTGHPVHRDSLLSMRDSVYSTTSDADAAETIAFQIPKRTDLRSTLEDKKGLDDSREGRVSAAVLRARELRAKLQPIEARRGDDNTDGQRSPSLGSTGETKPKPKIDPFAKNPTSGKVASIAARFKEPNALSPAPQRNVSGGGARSPSLGSSASGRSGISAGGQVGLERSGSPLTQAALAKATALVDPEMPPSPRQPDSGFASVDNESLAPDDAASNYSRSTEAADDGDGAHNAGWTRSSQAQHESQKAMQNALLQQDGSREEDDKATELPTSTRQEYWYGAPLGDVAEERESMLSGSNGR